MFLLGSQLYCLWPKIILCDVFKFYLSGGHYQPASSKKIVKLVIKAWGKGGWRDGSGQKPFSRRFESQHPHDCSNCNFNSQGSSTFFWPTRAPGTYMVHRHTCSRNTHIHKIKKVKILKLENWFTRNLVKEIYCVPPLASYALKYDKKLQVSMLKCRYISFVNVHALHIYIHTKVNVTMSVSMYVYMLCFLIQIMWNHRLFSSGLTVILTSVNIKKITIEISKRL